MKKTIQFMQHLLLMLVTLMSVASVNAANYDFKAANSDGVTIYYKVNGDNATVVAGDEKYTGSVNIPETVTNEGTEYVVTAIGDEAFEYNYKLTSVVIPVSVSTIGKFAFSGCYKLTQVNLPSKIETIGYRAFYGCGMSSIHIPASVTSIGVGVFGGISELKSITVDAGNAYYDSRQDCNAIVESATNILMTGCSTTVIPNTITIIGEQAFSQMDVKVIEIPNGVTEIGENAFFYNLHFKTVKIPHSVKKIGKTAFQFCELSNIEFSEGLVSIESGAFSYNHSLETIDIPSSVTSIGDNAFYNCENLAAVTSRIQQPFIISNDVFAEKNLDAVLYVPAGTKELYQNTAGWEFENIVEMEPANNAYAVWCESNTTLYFLQSNEQLTAGGSYDGQVITKVWSGADINESGEVPVWNEVVKTSVTKVVFEENFKDVTPTSTSCWFDSCEKLEAIQGLTNLNTSHVTNMYHMFYLCSNLTSLDLGKFDTSNVTNMQALFSGCSGISGLDVSTFNTENVTNMQNVFANCSYLIRLNVDNFNTKNVTNMFGMFQGCKALKYLDLSKFDTQNVTNMSHMFNGCSGLKDLNLSSFNTGNVTDMSSMFYSCGGLTTIDLSNFTTDNVTDMRWMFYNCNDLTDIDLSHFNTSNLTEMRTMFGECLRLEKVNMANWNTNKVTSLRSLFFNCTQLKEVDISSFDTRNIKTMRLMFLGCYNLKELDLSNFNTSLVEDVDSMFKGCTALRTIYAGDEWTMDRVITHKDMFENCKKIVGGNGTTYNSSYTNATYARIDREGTPGYLTYKAAKTTQTITLAANLQTLCSAKALDFTGVEGLKAYIASGFSPSTGEVIMSSVNIVPAKTGLLLVGTAGQEYEVPFTETDFIYSNLFRGLVEDVEVTSGYVLSGNEFVAVNDAVIVKGGEAYLNVTPAANAPRLTIRLTDTTDLSDVAGVSAVLYDEAEASDAWYTLQGVQLKGKPSKTGIYLHQGRKVIVK